jgi:hypothetical protein
MKTRLMTGLLLVGLLGTGYASADCLYPKVPGNIPDGLTATEQQMIDGMKATKEYNTQVTAYLSCLDMEMQARIDAAGADAPADQIAQIKAIQTKRHNAAVEELEGYANRFNDQVKAYKNKGKEKDEKKNKKS